MTETADLQRLKIERRSASPTGSRRKRGGLGWLVLAVVIAIGAYLFRGPVMEWIDSLRLPKVRVSLVQKTSALAATAVSGTAANGYIVASKRAALSADTPGRIVELNVTEGSIVKKGQVVARLYAEEFAAALRRAEAELAAQSTTIAAAVARRDATQADLARLSATIAQSEAQLAETDALHALAKINLDRAERMLSANVWNQQAVDDARTELDRAAAAREAARSFLEANKAALVQGQAAVQAAEAEIREAQARVPVLEAERDGARATLEKTEVRAPFDGIVVLKDAEVGEVVSPNSQGANSRGSVATMVDWASLEVQVELPETNLAAAQVDAKANVYLDAFPSVLYTGRVTRIWPTANRQKATVEVRIGFDAPDDKLRPEMGARVVFSPKDEPQAERPRADTILVPLDAIVSIGGKRGAFVLERDVARWRGLDLGEERSGRVLVRSGLSDGEQIVVAPPPSLADGQRVQIER